MKQSIILGAYSTFYVLAAFLFFACTKYHWYMAIFGVFCLWIADEYGQLQGAAKQREILEDNDLYEHMNYE